MIVEHTLEISALCPVDGKPDVYRCVVTTARVIDVESILAATASLGGRKIYQEELTQELHRILAARVETVGCHSGVTTKVIVGGIS